MSNNQIKENKQFKNRKNKDLINFPVHFRKRVLSPVQNPKLLEAPVTSFRILFKVLNNISTQQFQPEKQPGQLILFEQEFMTEHNCFGRFTFPIDEIDPNRDYTAIKKGLEFLENLERGWHNAVNSKGKTIKSYGGVISHSNISDGAISFIMSSYWIDKLLKVPAYNTAFFETAWYLSKSKQVLFYLWLLEVGDKGTQISFEKFQKVYDYNYKTTKDFSKGFLKVIKKKLDQYSNYSFNFSIKGDIISIVPYHTKNVDLPLSDQTVSRQKITQRLHYWKMRHSLSVEHLDTLKSIINLDSSTFGFLNKCYSAFVQDCREGGLKTVDFKSDEFMKLFQEKIIELYQGSVWGDIDPEGYPVITAG